LKQLTDFTLTHFFPHLGAPSKESYAQLLREVSERTARLMAHWQAVGFVHGVMNTDNMSILGLTIDYGPYGWVDDFDPAWTPNTTDAQMRRYRYGAQPQVGLWNVERLAVALSPLFDDEKPIEDALHAYQRTFEAEAARRFCAKLGLQPNERGVEHAYALFSWMAAGEVDMTIFFRALAGLVEGPEPTALPDAFYDVPAEGYVQRGLEWLRAWWHLTRQEDASPQVLAQRLRAVNPKYVARNYLAQEAIDLAHQGDASGLATLMQVLERPFDEQPGRERYAQKRPDWARSKPGCSALSCSS
jgi:serine/tyrosine/threonine adenylyltransferase